MTYELTATFNNLNEFNEYKNDLANFSIDHSNRMNCKI
jgi:hypothetical protein